MNYEAIVRVPYTTLPNFEKYDGLVFNDPPDAAHLAAKAEMFADDATFGQSWFETETARQNDLIRKAAERLGIGQDVPSIKDLALLMQEDIAIMHQGKLEACCFMFPSGWAPETKRAMSFAELHEPVADGERLRASADRITTTMCGEHSYHRYIWGVASVGRLSAHPRYKNLSCKPKSLDDIWFRYEHQITVPVEAGQTSAFTVDVQVIPYSELSEGHRERIVESIATMSDAVIAYKDIAPYKAILLPNA